MFKRTRQDPSGSFPTNRSSSGDNCDAQDVEMPTHGVAQPQLPPDVEQQLANAWFAMRRTQYANPERDSQAVDVDKVRDMVDEPIDPRGGRPPRTSRRAVTPDPNGGGGDGESISITSSEVPMSSTISFAGTDNTPVMSNRLAKPHHSIPVSSHTICIPHQQLRRHRVRCLEFFDVSKWYGKVLWLLIVLLVLSVATVASMAVLANGNSDETTPTAVNGSSDDTTTKTTTTTTTTTTSSGPTTAETSAPTVASVILQVTTEEPTRAPMFMDNDGTSTPILLSTPAPTPDRRNDFVPPPPTLQPTRVPSTMAPSSATTILQTLIAPNQPTVLSPAIPNPEPTQSLEDLVQSLNVSRIVNGNTPNDGFGSTVALSANGKVMAIGAPTSNATGRVYIYEYKNAVWQERDVVNGRTQNDRTGQRVAINRDGSVLAVAEPNRTESHGSVRLFVFDAGSNSYKLIQEISGVTEMDNIGDEAVISFGTSLAVSESGQYLVIGSPFYSNSKFSNQGQVRIYEYASGRHEWVRIGDPIDGGANDDWLGWSVAILEASPLTVVTSAPHSLATGGYVTSYQYDGVDWQRNGTIANKNGTTDDYFGSFLSLTHTGTVLRLAIGSPFTDNGSFKDVGATIVYDFDNNQWNQVGLPITFTGANEQAGHYIKLLGSGNLMLMGCPGYKNQAGAVKLFRWNDVEFVEDGLFLERSNGQDFGVALDATRRSDDDRLVLVVGALSGVDGGPGYVVILEEQV